MKRIFFCIIILLAGMSSVSAQSEMPADTVRTAVRTVSAGISLCALTDDMPASKMMMQKKIRFIVLCSQFQLLSAA